MTNGFNQFVWFTKNKKEGERMNLKQLICNYLSCSEEEKNVIQKLIQERNGLAVENTTLSSKVKNLLDNLTAANISIADQQGTIKSLQQQLQGFVIPPYQGKHIPAEITYGRYMMSAKDKIIFTTIDVRQFITPNNFTIYNKIENAKQFYDTTKDFDVVAPKLYQLAKTTYDYASDNQFGFGEVWLFPFELMELRNNQGMSGDCEDWANMIGSYFACAGMPRDRWWVSAGDTRSGYGHGTFYAKDNNGVWHHMNSTTPQYNKDNLKDFPLKDDESDSIGIKPDGFWFSYNDYFAISDFTTNANRSTQSALKGKIKIKRRKR